MAIVIPETTVQSVASLCRRFHVKELSLFGSALREDFAPSSDIDLLVEFEPGAEVGLMAFLRLQRELVATFGRPIDLVPKDGLRPKIRAQVLSALKVLYAA